MRHPIVWAAPVILALTGREWWLARRGWVFCLPMAVVGVPPLVVSVVGLIDLLHQFWVHTRPLEAGRWSLRAALLAASPVHGGVWLGLWCMAGVAGWLTACRSGAGWACRARPPFAGIQETLPSPAPQRPHLP